MRFPPLLTAVLLIGATASLAGAQRKTDKKYDRKYDRIERRIEEAAERAGEAAERAAERVGRALEEAFADADWTWDDEDDGWQGRGQERIDTTFAFSRDGVVDLSNISGEIIVEGWSRDEARISAHTERGELRSSFSNSRITIETRAVRGRTGETRYELSVPKGVRVVLRSTSGDVTARGTGGPIDASTTSGDVTAEGGRGRVSLESVSGDVRGSDLEGEIEASSVSADVMLDRVSGSLRVESTSGEIVLDGVRSSDVYSSTVSGEVSYKGSIESNGRYEFHSHSGNVSLEIPTSASAHFSVETFSGELDSDFPITLQPTSDRRERRPRRIEFNVGRGEARVIAESFSGDVIVRKQ
jgi:hypothetical protein